MPRSIRRSFRLARACRARERASRADALAASARADVLRRLARHESARRRRRADAGRTRLLHRAKHREARHPRPKTGKFEEIPLGPNSAPHGVIVGPDGAPWITDGGQNAIVRVDPKTHAVRVFPLGKDADFANLNTLTFDAKGRVWFTGQSGYYGRLVPETGDMKVWKSPRGRGPYGITTTPGGDVYYASLAGNHIARIDTESGAATVIEPPTKNQGARRVWSDSKGRIWVSYWNTGQVGMYDPVTRSWREWELPGNRPRAYSVWVDPADKVWLTEWTANAIVRFDPVKETFDVYPSDKNGANVRQMLGRAGEAWGAESGNARLVMVPAR